MHITQLDPHLIYGFVGPTQIHNPPNGISIGSVVFGRCL